MLHNSVLVNRTPEWRCAAGVTFLRIFLCVMLLIFFYCYKADAKALPESFAGLAAKLLPSVVNISTTQIVQSSGNPRHNFPRFPPGSPFEEFFKDFMERNGRRGDTPGGNDQNPKRRARSLGSGFIIDSSGIIVTNNHVIAEADEIKVRLQDDTEFEAEILGRDPKTDIAWRDRFRISGGLEPLTNPYIGEIISYGNSKGFKMQMYTNAYALTSKFLLKQPGIFDPASEAMIATLSPFLNFLLLDFITIPDPSIPGIKG